MTSEETHITVTRHAAIFSPSVDQIQLAIEIQFPFSFFAAAFVALAYSYILFHIIHDGSIYCMLINHKKQKPHQKILKAFYIQYACRAHAHIERFVIRGYPQLQLVAIFTLLLMIHISLMHARIPSDICVESTHPQGYVCGETHIPRDACFPHTHTTNALVHTPQVRVTYFPRDACIIIQLQMMWLVALDAYAMV